MLDGLSVNQVVDLGIWLGVSLSDHGSYKSFYQDVLAQAVCLTKR